MSIDLTLKLGLTPPLRPPPSEAPTPPSLSPHSVPPAPCNRYPSHMLYPTPGSAGSGERGADLAPADLEEAAHLPRVLQPTQSQGKNLSLLFLRGLSQREEKTCES
jgi:hypothetical protein